MKKKGKKLQVFKADLGMNDFYKHYIDKYCVYHEGKKRRINREDPLYIEKPLYGEIIKEFNMGIRDLMVYEAFQYVIPCRLGRIGIRKLKPKITINEDGKMEGRYPIDRKGTKELWDNDPEAKKAKKYVYHFNEHSDGYVAKFIYSKVKTNFVGKGKYFIAPTRTTKLMIKDVMTAKFKKHDYFISNTMKDAYR